MKVHTNDAVYEVTMTSEGMQIEKIEDLMKGGHPYIGKGYKEQAKVYPLCVGNELTLHPKGEEPFSMGTITKIEP